MRRGLFFVNIVSEMPATLFKRDSGVGASMWSVHNLNNNNNNNNNNNYVLKNSLFPLLFKETEI